MMSLAKNAILKGIVIKKIPYKDYHEIVHIFTENGLVESFFYENVNKNKKKNKLFIPTLVTTSFFRTSGMNKIINLDVDNYFSNIIYDIKKSSYIKNIIEIIGYNQLLNPYFYKLLNNLLDLINEDKIDEKLSNIYFIILFLKYEGFVFKYLKTNKNYAGYSFSKNMFIDVEECNNSFFKLDNKLIQLIYILSNNSVNILEKIHLDDSEINIVFRFINIILKEYSGIETKSYNKILELESILNSFEGDKNNE
ncbi:MULTISPECIES: DNA repair protein RecO [unclassified Gemella]|uniref:DNA repair protein RecO n=1 Tax=unclassified Gemella TaxID=2624949 RepID=UPI001C0545F5|nr:MULTISPECIES: DNA repair protein RecO [unclassified Gemella]MBU0278539.1 DNA repair protein RecO [Gemella sp. zg-1178]QWQ39426.1 DNA repair protein RecO [Gemella sp. zg-570]